MTDPANTAGPTGDGSKSLAKESKVGIAVTWATSVAALGVLSWLSNLDMSQWDGWWAATATSAVGAAVGLISAYLKKNR